MKSPTPRISHDNDFSSNASSPSSLTSSSGHDDDEPASSSQFSTVNEGSGSASGSDSME